MLWSSHAGCKRGACDESNPSQLLSLSIFCRPKQISGLLFKC